MPMAVTPMAMRAMSEAPVGRCGWVGPPCRSMLPTMNPGAEAALIPVCRQGR
jgi:hypothetical protein